MDNAEISTNPNAIDSFHGMDAHKKALFAGQHSEIDSGYGADSLSYSQSNSVASTSGLSSSAKFSSSLFKRSTDLEPISENIEMGSLQETPTTRSIRHLNAFHINTPQNDRNQMETTPKKANYFSNPYDSGSRGSDKQNNDIRWSLNKSSPRLRSQRKSLVTRSTLFESIDENYDENDDVVHPCDQSIGVSPINSSISISKPPENVQLQRHPSGIDSSTPLNSFKRTRTQSIIKTRASLAEATQNRLIRKTQSFSPAKRMALRERFQQNIIENECFEAAEQIDNPARKVLDFTPKKFDQLINNKLHHNVAATATDFNKQTQNEAETSVNATAKYLSLKRLDTHKSSSRLVKEFSKKKTMRHPSMMPNKATQSFNESDIFMSPATDQNETDSQQKCNDSNLTVSTMTTPSTNCKSQAIFSDTPNRSDVIKKSICEQANRTPTKRFEKSISHNFASMVKSSPEKEKFEIVYGHLPCTPPKKYPRRQLKRPAAVARADSPAASAPSAKRKLYTICQRPSFYNGLETLDILTHLKKFNKDDIIENIFQYLPDNSVQAAYSVCKSWKSFIDGNRKLRVRRRKFVKTMQTIKENVHHNEIKPIINNNNNVKPLHVHNLNCSVIEEKPMAVSPSTQRFNDNQSIVKSLKPEQHVLHCPRCNWTSIVHPATAEPKVQRKSPRRQLNMLCYYQDRSLRSSNGSVTKNRTNNGKIVVSEYAVCSKKMCGFEFCTNCNGNRHVNAKCTKRPLGSSPKSDEDSPYRSQHRATKRQLRRLGRLVF